MCGRFSITTDAAKIAALFDLEVPGFELGVDYNVTPTNDIWTVLEDEEGRRLTASHWGLVPSWADDPSIGSRMINARAETVAEKPAYRAAYRRRRCIIPVSGFYEWVQMPATRHKQPMYITARNESMLTFAGLWELWKAPDGSTLRSCSIITTTPNDTIAPYHDRMPVILDRADWWTWTDPKSSSVAQLLRPAPDDLLQLWPVSTEVNSARSSGPQLIERVEPTDPREIPGQGSLL